MTSSEMVLGLPYFEITHMEKQDGEMRISVLYNGPQSCPECTGTHLRSKGWIERKIRHENWGLRHCYLLVSLRKWQCLDCNRYFRQRLPGVLPWQRASEPFRENIYQQHLDGINRSRLGRREKIGAATVERYFQHGLRRQFTEWHPPRCPTVLGIDEHFFTRRKGFATTFCDLRNHKIYDVVLGRSELALEAFLQRLEGKDQVRVVCMDLASVYRSLVRRHFPNALIVADRFHVIRLVNHHFLACWRDLDPVASKNRGLLSLMRRHQQNLTPSQQLRLDAYLAQQPVLELIYRFKQKLCQLLLRKGCNRKLCARLVPKLLRAIDHLSQSGLAPLVQLGQTLHSWKNEVAAMWRFSKNNGITEGFHTKMELITRQAFGFRNFNNYRMRVKVLCG